MPEAHLINSPRVIAGIMYFSVEPNNSGVDMGSICSRCNLKDCCFGKTRSNRKDAHINLNDAPRIINITSSDTSNCGIILDLMARKNEVQKGFIPKPGYSTT